MTTHFITAEIDLQESPAKLHEEIVAELEKRGEPLRWAITDVDVKEQKATVEAIVTTTTELAKDQLCFSVLIQLYCLSRQGLGRQLAVMRGMPYQWRGRSLLYAIASSLIPTSSTEPCYIGQCPIPFMLKATL